MLLQLSIKNYALISHSVIHFDKHLSIITGETGAGKSILLDALGLVIGKRADLSALRNKEEKCIIEATFQIDSYGLEKFFQTNDIDFENTTLLRREILPSGKSRAFVNDTPVSLAVMQELGSTLIDIHSQHQTQELFEENHQLELVDAFSDSKKELLAYQKERKAYKKLVTELEELQTTQSQLIKEHDYHVFLFEELEAVQLKEDEEKQLSEEEELLSNVEKIQEHLSTSAQVLTSEQFGVISQLKEAKAHLNKLVSYHSDYAELAERLQSAEIELQDISSEIETKLDEMISDPQRLEYVQNRLQTITTLYKKHQVQSIEELVQIYEDLAVKVQQGQSIDEDIAKKESEVALQKQKVDDAALKLHDKRAKKLEKLAAILQEKIAPLGMPNARFQFDLQPTENYYATGKDQLQLLFSANKGMDFGLLKKTASGGELSRIMLVVKSVLASKSNLPTIIFDEIDTGVSGEVADKMGVIMREMGEYMQVFSITHLPQVAAKGAQHYKVFKHDNEERTTSEIIQLDKEQRIKEIAQMLSGTQITEAALQQAQALLQ